MGIDVAGPVRADKIVTYFDITRMPNIEVRVTASDLADLGVP
jgi:hypothetical protein